MRPRVRIKEQSELLEAMDAGASNKAGAEGAGTVGQEASHLEGVTGGSLAQSIVRTFS